VQRVQPPSLLQVPYVHVAFLAGRRQATAVGAEFDAGDEQLMRIEGELLPTRDQAMNANQAVAAAAGQLISVLVKGQVMSARGVSGPTVPRLVGLGGPFPYFIAVARWRPSGLKATFEIEPPCAT
jgi:hypothetical protein